VVFPGFGGKPGESSLWGFTRTIIGGFKQGGPGASWDWQFLAGIKKLL